MLLDVNREVYGAMGLGRSVSKVWNIQTLIYYAEQKAAGRALPKKFENVEDDPHQMGGDFIIDNHGAMALIHCSTSPTDRPSIEQLLKALQGLRKQDHLESAMSGSPPRKRKCQSTSENML